MSNIVSITNEEALTTSLAIAEGVGNQHKNVMELIRTNLNDFESFGRVTFQTRPFETAGGTQTKEYATLNEPQATLLMTYMRNSEIVKRFKIRLVKAFYELANNKPPMSRMDVLKLAMQAEEENIRLEAAIEEDRPKVEFHDRVAISEDAISVGKAAKLIGTGRQRLFDFLRQQGWVTRNNEPYQAKITSGHMNVKLGKWTHPDQGLQSSVTALVTGKGLAELQKIYGEPA
ncbi:MAG: phage regulatory protein/antirepressor Ant [Blastopirellula sp.]|nr:MAG: phage regulatory protein/antirepressor Ant [Blastopirellula sp.]